jgi:RNA polymerase sigma factor (TIGR02999 family)
LRACDRRDELQDALAKMEGSQVTQLLAAHRGGDAQALGRAFELVYDDLRHLASAQRWRNPTPTLDTTSLVHEAYVRLVDRKLAAPADRGHFLALAARAMRHIIIDYARERAAHKRGGAIRHIQLDDAEIAVEDQAQQLLSLDEAMQLLNRLDERLVRIVECRFFVGLTEEETAEALETSLSTVQRDWKRAKAWLKEAMRDGVM